MIQFQNQFSNRRFLLGAALVLSSAASTAAQTEDNALSTPAPQRVPSAGSQTDQPYSPGAILPGGIVMPLYAADSVHLKAERINEPEKYNLSDSVHGRINSIVNIHNPSIEVHFASPSMNTGAVVILAAGGGHRTLNVGTESADFVPYFFNYGVNTVILRNRLRSDGYEPSTDAVRDALQSIRLVRKFAERWRFDPHKIGIMGFSAGAELSAPAAIQFEQFDKENSDPNDPLAGVTSRPDFVGIIYPGPTPFTRDPETEVPRNMPPAFITCAGAGDRIHAIWAMDYFSATLRAGIPNVELHIYGNGYHPGDRGSSGGLTYRKGIPFGSWQDRFIDWFDDLGFLDEPGVETKAAKDSQEFVSSPPPRRGGFGPGRGRGGPGGRGPGGGPRPQPGQGAATEKPATSPYSGSWYAKFDTQAGEQEYSFEIKPAGDSLAISAAAVFMGEPREVVFKEVKQAADKLTFVEAFEFDGNELRIEYSVVLDGSKLKVARKVGDFATEEFEATKSDDKPQ